MANSDVKIYQDIELSLTGSGVPAVVPVKQFDNLSRIIRCTLCTNTGEYVIPENIIIAYSGRRPDGRLFQYSTEAVDNDRIVLEENKLLITVTNFMTEVSGRCPIDIVLIDSSGATLCSFSFVLYVEKSAVPEPRYVE